MKSKFILTLCLLGVITVNAQIYSGTVVDAETALPLSGVEVEILQDSRTTVTNADGSFSITALSTSQRTIKWEKTGYMVEQQYHLTPVSGMLIRLRAKKLSLASQRWADYEFDCAADVPEDPDWSIRFKQTLLKGDLAPNPYYTRRDPSSVIQVDGIYYVWYSYSLTDDIEKWAPWDMNDIYYATSVDGITWEEQGAAVVRGGAGSYDARSVFTTEVFEHEGMFYLVYQCAKNEEGVYGSNTVGMSYASSASGSWIKLDEPILRPTNTDEAYFDNTCVHDPCLIFYNDKYHLYYKGESFNSIGYCGRHIKWGIAISDDPLGPYVKSEYNPVTTTGHEVMIWKFDEGIAILQHKDGPEYETIQYAEDGVNFEMMGSARNIPEAAGIFRPDAPENTPHGGIPWGVCHILRWDSGFHGWMYIQRFESIAGHFADVAGIDIPQDTIYLLGSNVVKLDPNISPYDAQEKGVSWTSSNASVVSVNSSSHLSGSLSNNMATVYAETFDGGYTDSVVVIVCDPSTAISIEIEGEDFTNEGGYLNDGFGTVDDYVQNDRGFAYLIDTADWIEYDIEVEDSGMYQMTIDLACAYEDSEITWFIDGNEVASERVPSNGLGDYGAADFHATVAKDFIFLDEGDHTIKFLCTGSGLLEWNVDKFELLNISMIDSSEINIDTLGIHTFTGNNSISLYPNPANNIIQIVGLESGTYNFSIVNIQGVDVYNESFSYCGNNPVIDISHLPAGVYIIRITNSIHSFSKRFIKTSYE